MGSSADITGGESTAALAGVSDGPSGTVRMKPARLSGSGGDPGGGMNVPALGGQLCALYRPLVCIKPDDAFQHNPA